MIGELIFNLRMFMLNNQEAEYEKTTGGFIGVPCPWR